MIDATLELAAPFQESLIREQLRLLRRYSHSEGEPDAGLGRSERHTQCPDTTLGRLTVERVSLISRSTKLGLAMAVVERANGRHNHAPTASDASDILATIAKLQKALPGTRRTLDFVRGMKIFDGPHLYVIKPDTGRFWTQSAALNDADEIAGTLVTIPARAHS